MTEIIHKNSNKKQPDFKNNEYFHRTNEIPEPMVIGNSQIEILGIISLVKKTKKV
jgi:uncharacterized FlgJ-related protein